MSRKLISFEVDFRQANPGGIPLSLPSGEEISEENIGVDIDVEDFDDTYITFEPEKEDIIWENLDLKKNETNP